MKGQLSMEAVLLLLLAVAAAGAYFGFIQRTITRAGIHTSRAVVYPEEPPQIGTTRCYLDHGYSIVHTDKLQGELRYRVTNTNGTLLLDSTLNASVEGTGELRFGAPMREGERYSVEFYTPKWKASDTCSPRLHRDAVLYLPMDGTSGRLVRDRAPDYLHGTLSGDHSGAIEGATWWKGTSGRALRFNDADYVEVDELNGTNLVPNPSFESGSPANWTCNGDWNWTTDAHSGSRAIRLNGTESDNNYCSGDTFTVEPDTHYKFSYWIKRDPSAANKTAITDLFGFEGWARGSEMTLGKADRLSAGWSKKEYLVKTFPGVTQASVRFYRYKVNGSLYFDDFKVEEATPGHREVEAAKLGWDERIEGGNYTHHSQFSWHQQAVRPLANLTDHSHATRLSFGAGDLVEFEYDVGGHEQQAGKLSLNITYLASGNCTVEARNETSGWQLLGWFNDTGWQDLTVPAQFYPTTDPIYVRARDSSGSGSFQIHEWKYTSELGSDPGDNYGYTSISQFDPVDGVTAAAWVEPTACDNGTIVGKAERGWTGYELACDSGRLHFSMAGEEVKDAFTDSSVSYPLPTGGWAHVAGAWNGTRLALYLNGSLVNSTPLARSTSIPANLQIGSSEGHDTFQGTIDDVRIYARGLSDSEVQQLYSGQDVADRLVGHWPLDEGSGTGARDEHFRVPGLRGGALNLDGTDDYVSLSGHPDLTRSFSVLAWVKPATGPPASQVFFSACPNTTQGKCLSTRIHSDGRLRLGFYNDDLVTSSGNVTFGEWQHVAATYDYANDTSRLYVNGRLVANGTSGPFTGSSPPVYVGRWFSGHNWKGLLDELAVYDRALPPKDIEAIYGGLAG